MENKTDNKKKRGRKPSDNKAKFRYSVNLTEEDNMKLQLLMHQAGVDNISRYIHNAIFNKELKVVKIDKATTDYYIQLTNFYRQFQAIGNNYNQTVKAIKSNFGEKRALSMLYKLEKTTIELIVLNKKIIELTKEFEEKHLKNNR